MGKQFPLPPAPYAIDSYNQTRITQLKFFTKIIHVNALMTRVLNETTSLTVNLHQIIMNEIQY